MPALSEQRHGLIQFAQDEIDRFRKGEVDRISSIDEISLRFGLGKPRIYEVFSKARLTKERRAIEHETRVIVFPHSRDAAWMLGILAAGGNTRIGENGTEGVVRFTHKKEQIRDRFRTLGEKIFKSPATPKLLPEGASGNIQNETVSFHNLYAAQAVGDMKRDTWPKTLQEQHSWVTQNPEYIWGFLEGFFEERGRLIHKYQKGEISHHQLHLQTSSLQAVLFLRDALATVDIHHTSSIKSSATNNGIAGVCISNIPEIKLFARNVHSLNVEKEGFLDFYRKIFINREVYADKDIVQEWMRVTDQLGHNPNSDDIRRLRKEGKTRFSVGLYANRFGGENKSFTTARVYLETIYYQTTRGRVPEATMVKQELSEANIAVSPNVYASLSIGVGIRNNIGLLGRFIGFHEESGKRYARVTFPSGFQSLFLLESLGIKFHVVPPEEEGNYIQDDKTASRKIYDIVTESSNPWHK